MSNAVNIRHEAADITTAIEDDLLALVRDMQDRLTKLESRDKQGLLGKLFGRGSAAAVLLAVFLISGTAWAEYSVRGLGIDSCARWTNSMKHDFAKFEHMLSWVNGYVTAYSLFVEDGVGPVTESDLGDAFISIDKYCLDNPSKIIASAAEHFVYELRVE